MNCPQSPQILTNPYRAIKGRSARLKSMSGTYCCFAVPPLIKSVAWAGKFLSVVCGATRRIKEVVCPNPLSHSVTDKIWAYRGLKIGVRDILHYDCDYMGAMAVMPVLVTQLP